jgi:hypothetical protein
MIPLSFLADRSVCLFAVPCETASESALSDRRAATQREHPASSIPKLSTRAERYPRSQLQRPGLSQECLSLVAALMWNLDASSIVPLAGMRRYRASGLRLIVVHAAQPMSPRQLRRAAAVLPVLLARI